MLDGKCTTDPERECDVRHRVIQVEHELSDLRRQNAGTHERFGERIGELEAHNKVQDVEVKNLQKSIDAISGDLKDVKAEAKEISKQIPVIATQVSAIHENSKAMDSDMDELKSKPGETWEHIKKQGLGWLVALLLAILAAALGLGKYL